MLPNPLTILLRGQQTLTVTDAVSESSENVTYSDGTNYRDLFPSSYVGAQWDATANAIIVPWVSPGTWMGLDDQVNHTAPRNAPKTRTMMKWLDSGGAVRGKCWADQFVGYADSATFVQ